MHLNRGIVCTYKRSGGISTIPDNPDNLTHQSAGTNDAPGTLFTAPLQGEEDAQNSIKTVYFSKQENQVKQDQHEGIDKKTSNHSRNWICNTILLLLTILMKSSRILR